MKTLVLIMLDENAPAAARVTAANSILDRGWGKPIQGIANADGGPLELVHRIERIIVHPDKAPEMIDLPGRDEEATSQLGESRELTSIPKA